MIQICGRWSIDDRRVNAIITVKTLSRYNKASLIVLAKGMIICMTRKPIILILLVFVVFSGLFWLIDHYNKEIDIQASDIELSATIRPFYESNEYQTYMGKNESKGIYETVRVDVFWKVINPELSSPDKLWYPPNIIIVPPDDNWTFIGGSKNMPLLYGNRGSIEANIKKAIGNEINKSDWDKIDIIGTTTQVKSFGQGYVSFAYINSELKNETNPQFTFYFIYYDPTLDKGWYKKVVQTANLAGLPTKKQ